MSRTLHPARYWGTPQDLSGASELMDGREATDLFIGISQRVHGRKKFGYDRTEFRAFLLSLTVTCPRCGDISVTPKNHLALRSGCPACERRIYG